MSTNGKRPPMETEGANQTDGHYTPNSSTNEHEAPVYALTIPRDDWPANSGDVNALPKALQTLADRPQWVCFRLEYNGKKDAGGAPKPDKVPYNPHANVWRSSPIRTERRGGASSTDPATWGTYREAIAAMRRLGAVGVGLVFHPECSPLLGIDLDGYLKDGHLNATGRAIVRTVDSYAEISPSGDGIHVLAEGTLPPGRRKDPKTGIEVYERARFFTVTGKHLADSPDRIENRTTELAAFHSRYLPAAATPPAPPVSAGSASLADQAVLDLAFDAKNGHTVSALYNGDISGYASASEADAALLGHLAFYTQDPAQLQRLLLGSKLRADDRTKFGRQDYLDVTIAGVLGLISDKYEPPGVEASIRWGQDVTNGYRREAHHKATGHGRQHQANGHRHTDAEAEPETEAEAPDHEDDEDQEADPEAPSAPSNPFQIINDDELEDLPDPEWLIEETLAESAVTVLYGPSGCGKSFVALDWFYCVTTGLDWLGRTTRRSGQGLYIAAEGAKGIKKRRRAWKAARGVDELPNAYYLPMPVLLNDEKQALLLYQAITSMGLRPRIIVIDTLAQCFKGDESQSEAMTPFTRMAQRLVHELDATVLIVHHTGKDKESMERGSSALRANVDGMIRLTSDDEGHMAMTMEKVKNWEAPTYPIKLARQEYDDSCIIVDDADQGAAEDTKSQAAIVRTLQEFATNDGLTDTELKGLTGLKKSTYYRAKKALVNANRIVKKGTRWALGSTMAPDKDPHDNAESHGSTEVPRDPHGTSLWDGPIVPGSLEPGLGTKAGTGTEEYEEGMV